MSGRNIALNLKATLLLTEEYPLSKQYVRKGSTTNLVGNDRVKAFKISPERLFVTVFDPKTRAKKYFSIIFYSRGYK